MKAWTTFSCPHDDEDAISVPEGWTDVMGALLELLTSETGAVFDRDNPVLTEEAKSLHIETWSSCTKRWCEDNGIYPEDYGATNWWAPDGDGKRSVRVLHYPGSLWVLSERAMECCPTCGGDGPDEAQTTDEGAVDMLCGNEWHDKYAG